MLIPFGVFSAAGAGGGGAAGDYELISTTLLGSTASTVSFSSLPSGYKHLQLRLVAQGTTGNANLTLRFNSDAGNNYSWHSLFGNGSSVSADSSASRSNITEIAPVLASSNTNIFTTSVIDMLDVFSSSKNKTLRWLTGRAVSGANFIGLDSGAWYSTSAVTSFEIAITTGSINTGSRFSLYGIRG